MNKVFFSIIIPTHNRAAYLPKSIASVVGQSFKDWELLVIDDGSTDNSKEVVSSFQDERVKYFYKKHEERSIARNYGISGAKGEYICFLDSDDLYFEDHLQILYSRIASESFPVGLFNTGMNIKRNNGNETRPVYDPEIYDHPLLFVWDKFLLINSVCVHSAILEKNKFPEEFHVWEDTHLWLRVVAQCPFFQIPEVTTQWNVHKQTSVARSFERIDSRHINVYLSCIRHLFDNYAGMLNPFLTREDMKKYIYQKLTMFLTLSFQDKHYFTFIKLYLLGLRFVEFRRLSRFVYRTVSTSLRKDLKHA